MTWFKKKNKKNVGTCAQSDIHAWVTFNWYVAYISVTYALPALVFCACLCIAVCFGAFPAVFTDVTQHTGAVYTWQCLPVSSCSIPAPPAPLALVRRWKCRYCYDQDLHIALLRHFSIPMQFDLLGINKHNPSGISPSVSHIIYRHMHKDARGPSYIVGR